MADSNRPTKPPSNVFNFNLYKYHAYAQCAHNDRKGHRETERERAIEWERITVFTVLAVLKPTLFFF